LSALSAIVQPPFRFGFGGSPATRLVGARLFVNASHSVQQTSHSSTRSI